MLFLRRAHSPLIIQKNNNYVEDIELVKANRLKYCAWCKWTYEINKLRFNRPRQSMKTKSIFKSKWKKISIMQTNSIECVISKGDFSNTDRLIGEQTLIRKLITGTQDHNQDSDFLTPYTYFHKWIASPSNHTPLTLDLHYLHYLQHVENKSPYEV